MGLVFVVWLLRPRAPDAARGRLAAAPLDAGEQPVLASEQAEFLERFGNAT